MENNENKIDVTKPVTNPRLLKLFEESREVFNHEALLKAKLNEVFEEIALRANFLAIIHMEPGAAEKTGENTAVFKKDSVLGLQMIQRADGKVFLPVFTDWTKLREWPNFKEGEVQTLIMPFDHIAAFMNGEIDGITINPFSDNFLVSREQIAHLKNRKEQLGNK